MELEVLAVENQLDEYAALAHRAVAQAKAMYPDAKTYAAEGDMGEVPVLCELPDGEILVVRYYGH